MEAADSPSTSSKVIVQCTDPYNLFEKILPELQARQKLGNLHWKSSTRPLRSIDRLDVSFTREEKQDDSSNSARRHQIPGLRQTPFVKILLLRCDDRETYKETTRKEVKQWLKSQGLSTDGKSSARGQESHDAFEHIILHVVLPNTPAAAQPKSSKHVSVEANESTDSVNSKAKWPGKGSSTIYDKLRADFSSSSKVPFERIAQIRILDADARSTTGLSPSENTDLWQDFVDKLKAAILASFDVRVAQYEDDIKDRDSQRSLPGWNFCTFFILKEGLARGFENVGLLEDALTVYDELDAGLDIIVQEQAAQGDIDSAGSLLPFSKDLKPAIRSALETLSEDSMNSNATPTDLTLSELVDLEQEYFPFDIAKLDYQQRILTNQVSALELRVYLFTRKLHLFFRRSRSAATPSKAKSVDDRWRQQHDIGSVAEITERTLQFIAFGARGLYQDLHSAWGGYEGLDEEERETQKRVIGNLVASWKFSALMQIIRDCHILTLIPLDRTISSYGTVQSNGHEQAHSKSRDSGQYNSQEQGYERSNGTQSAMDALERRQSTLISLQQSSQPQIKDLKDNARDRLALWVAELCVRARGIIMNVETGATESSISKRGLIASATDHPDHTVNDDKHIMAGLRSPCLRLVVSSVEKCHDLSKMFTIYAYQCYNVAKQQQASRQMLLSLAEMEISQDLPNRAVYWLEQISDISSLNVRTLTDFSVLALYTRSLRTLDRPNDYAKALLSTITASSSSMGALAVKGVGIDLQELLDEFLAASLNAEPCNMNFDGLFRIYSCEKSINHIERRDGFAISLSVYMRVPGSVIIPQEMVLNLTAAQQNEPETIILRSRREVKLTQEVSNVVFQSDVTAHGWYNIESVMIRIGNITFKHKFLDATTESDVYEPVLSTRSPVMVYARAGSLSTKVYPAPSIDLTDTTRVRIGIGAGDNDIQTVLMRIKPFSAGVRLNIQAAELQDEDGVENFEVKQTDRGIGIELRNLTREQVAVFDIPYSMEKALLRSVEVKFEVCYTTSDGDFELFCTESFNPVLPITVNVQDVFQIDGLYSVFTAGPATEVPVRVVQWRIDDSDHYEVQTGEKTQTPVQTFVKSHTSWAARIVKKSGQATDNGSGKMPLTVEYQCLDDEILSVIEEQFLTDLETGPFAFASTLLTKHLTNHVSQLWTESELEMIALLQEIKMWSYEEMEWKETLRALNSKERAGVEAWLREWHREHEHIDLPHTQACTRFLRLVVDVPQPAVVIAVEVRLQNTSPGSIVVGQSVQAEVIVSCVRHTSENLLVDYEVSGQIETWLVGGRKRGSFHASSKEVRYSVLLVAQRSGNVLLPSVDIKVRRLTEARGSPTPIFEVEHKSQAESVQVIPAVQTTTITLDSSINGVGYRVIGSLRV